MVARPQGPQTLQEDTRWVSELNSQPQGQTEERASGCGTMAGSADTIVMPALGRPFQLGMLYDCRSDSLIPGVTLWGLDQLLKDVSRKPQPRTEFEIIASDTIEDKANALNVTASLKASFLGGLVEVSGSAKYLNDTKTSKQQARVTLQYSATTKFEQLTMNHLGPENVSYRAVFDQGTATHVVTAVLYGAQAFFVFDREVSSSENVREIEGKLKLAIKIIPPVSIEGEGAVKMDDREKLNAENFNCKFHGDFALEKNPTNLQDAMKMYSTLPKLLGDSGENAVPMRVWLYPLTKLDSRAARLVREISLTLISDAQTAMEELAELNMRCNDMVKNPITTSFPEIKQKIQQFRDLCKQHRQTFQKQLASLLPSIRGGGKEEGALVDILSWKNQSPFNTQRLSEFLDTKEKEVNYVNSYLRILSNVEVVSSQSELDKIVLDPDLDFIVSFTFTSLCEEEPYLSDLKQWLQTQFIKETHDPALASSVAEKPKSKVWFEEKKIYQKARKSAKSLSHFVSVNKPNRKTRFIVASVPDKDNPGTSIYLYGDGELISTNFEPPSKPLPPLIDGIRHDRVQLTFNPAAYGRAEISGYRAEYRIVGQENWTAVTVNNTQETFTVTGLRANTEYQFRYAAVSKPGLSESSDVSDPVKTLPPTSSPGKPVTVIVDSSAIALSWESPSVTGDGVRIKEYKVEYKEDAGDTGQEGKDKWLERRTGKRTEFCSVDGLRPETSYRFRVSAVCADGAVSDPSEETCISTLKKANVTLDPDTAHPELILSEDRRSVSRGHESQMLPYKPERFDYLLSVLGSEGFTSGKHSWQVKVEGGASADWAVGVAKQSVLRKGEVGFTPEEGVWVVQKWGSAQDYRAHTSPVTRLSLSRKPSRIWVSLDYEGGSVAFNYADNLAPIFTFPRASFNGEKIFPFFWVWGTGFQLSLHP
ncbi:stonustoxin subunit alpha-like [Mauremys reevesii]|uniref:stonustoxin subunit alpha-like n=1 Tax=Mauremys reevesii TaxID=260615 RepID=UPI00193F2D7E|nr:stonustoxin subunit alpha-like [Mauremys reevesii]